MLSLGILREAINTTGPDDYEAVSVDNLETAAWLHEQLVRNLRLGRKILRRRLEEKAAQLLT